MEKTNPKEASTEAIAATNLHMDEWNATFKQFAIWSNPVLRPH